MAMLVSAILAFPACIMYLTVPRLLDRYDPEPWYALVGSILWGGTVCVAFAGIINTTLGAIGTNVMGPAGGEVMMAVFSAPIFEEALKGLGVFGVFFFLRREFDGVVDGIIYACFVALGFAAVENVTYYASSALNAGSTGLTGTFILRGVLSPWIHPLFTSMTGIGLGVAREATKPSTKLLAPFTGYAAAVFLHALWNGSATAVGAMGESGNAIFLVMLPLWFLFVGAFLAMVVVLVRRRGKVIRDHLLDEVAMGTINKDELELVASPFGIFRARLRFGTKGEEFVRACARLALSKWHVSRAMISKGQTISFGFVVPLRQRIHQLRTEQNQRRR